MRNTKHSVAVVVAGALALGSVAPLLGADWLHFRGRNHDGKSAETGDLVLAEASPTAYKELGSAHVIEGRAFTAPVFANGKVYARNTKGDVVCLDLSGR